MEQLRRLHASPVLLVNFDHPLIATLQVEQLDINYGQGMMLLPITVEHTIDERSPLWGHSHDSLLVRQFPAVAPLQQRSYGRNRFYVIGCPFL